MRPGFPRGRGKLRPGRARSRSDFSFRVKPAIPNVGQTFQSAGSRNFPVPCSLPGGASILHPPSSILNPRAPRTRSAFSLVELLIVMTLLTLIVLALMDVFSSTQRAFRASVTQVDVLEGSRAAMELITADLRKMSPSGGNTNAFLPPVRDVNFYIGANPSYTPLSQNLPGSKGNRLNLLQYFFILSRENTTWTGTGYVVDTTSVSPLYPLYRYHATISATQPPRTLFTNFLAQINNGTWTNMSHLVDGVVHLVVRPYDPNGIWLTNGYAANMTLPRDAVYYGTYQGEVNADFSGAAIPASVEVQMGVIEDRALARAESLPNNLPALPPNDRRTLYLANQSGAVHVFRQHVNIPNVDRSVYP